MIDLQAGSFNRTVMSHNILLVEDNPDHVMLIKKALGDDKVIKQIDVCVDGQEAIDYLHDRKKYEDLEKYPRPGLILLDIGLPRKSGLEVLSYLKNDESLKLIPVIMFTTSQRDEDIRAAYEDGANSYITKPVDFAEFVQTVKNLKIYWCLINTPAEISVPAKDI